MSSSSYSYSYFSSSSSSSSTDPAGTTNRYTEQATSNNRDGTTIHRRAEETGKPPVSQTTTVPADEIVSDSGRSGAGGLEDVSNRDAEYEERMEDEYAKREGGA